MYLLSRRSRRIPGTSPEPALQPEVSCTWLNLLAINWRHCAGLFIESIYIKPEYRGRGYGKAAFEKMARTALERGCVRIEWCCLDWNPALEFYRAIGADIMDDLTVCRLNTDGIHRLANGTAK